MSSTVRIADLLQNDENDPIAVLHEIQSLPRESALTALQEFDSSRLDPTRKSLYFIALILAGEKKDSQRLRELYKSLVAADPRYSNLNVYFRIPDAENGDEEAIRELARARVLGPNMLVFIPGKASTDALYEIAAEKDNPFGERVEAAEALIRRKDPSIADVVVSDEFASGWRSDGSENSLNQWISALIGSTSDQEVVVDREQLLRWMKTIDAD